MAGQIIKRGDKTWLVRIFTGRDSRGKRRYLNKTIRGNKKDAETYLSKTLTAMNTGTFVEPSVESLSDYLDRWLAAVARPRVRERTFDDYVDKLDRYIRPSLGACRLSDLCPLDIQKAYADLQTRGLAPRTIRYAHSILASALKQAVLWSMLTRNPCDAVELPRHVRMKRRDF
jgi:integrase